MSASEPLRSEETDVLIVGAGPVGLSLGLQLAQAGIRAVVVERRSSLSRHPKANGIFSRTMEVFRQWGISEAVAQIALPPELCLGFVWLTRIKGIELGRIMLAADVAELGSVYSRDSPEVPRFAPQDRIEHLLARQIANQRSVELRMSTRAVGIDQDSAGAAVTVQDDSGRRYSIRARYVIGADGSRSSVKSLLGLPEETVAPWGESVNIYFESEEFDRLRAGRPYQLWWVVNSEVRGAFWPVSHRHRWIFTPEGIPGVDPSYYTPEVCADLIRKGAGAAVKVEVISSVVWHHEMGIAAAWRCGQVFLAGDCAHRFPPHGGFGMNSGIQDAHNLGWKLIAVLRGYAGEAILDSYEAERRPVAVANAAQTLRNTELIKETGWFVPDTSELAVIEEPAGEVVRQRISAAVQRQSASVHSQGQQFGAIYNSSAVISDASVPPISSVQHYRPSASPGARLPHLLIEGPQGVRSTIDLCRQDRLVLLVSERGDAWRQAARGLPVELPVVSVGRAGCDFASAEFASVCEVGAEGAVLIRPDGYVAWRSQNRPVSPSAALLEAVSRALSLN